MIIEVSMKVTGELCENLKETIAGFFIFISFPIKPRTTNKYINLQKIIENPSSNFI